MAKFFLKISIAFRCLIGQPVILSPEAIAMVMGVKTRDITNAIKNNQLLPGSHFFLINKEIRFHITDDLFRAIMKDCHIAAQRAQKTSDNNNSPGSNTLSKRRKADYPTTAQSEKKAA